MFNLGDSNTCANNLYFFLNNIILEQNRLIHLKIIYLAE